MAYGVDAPGARRIAVVVALALGTMVCGGAAHAQTLPVDAEFAPLRCGADLSYDPARDQAGASGERDIVGVAPDAALLFATDATFLYLRMRVAATPLGMDGTFRPFGWGFEFDTDGDFTAYEVLVILDGIANPDAVALATNSTPGTIGDPSDIAETTVMTYPAMTHAFGTAAGTTIGGTPNFYMTVAVPLADLASVGVDRSSAVIWAGTSANARSLNADFACHDGTTGDPSLEMVPPGTTMPGATGDSDGDGIPDTDERPGGMDRDTDMDGVPDHLDPDDDGDGVPTRDERPGAMDRDTDMDGTADHLDPDDDGDGIPTRVENTAPEGMDVDGDGIPNYLDLDSDGDGFADDDEGTGDGDGDGTPDYLDPDLGPDADGDGIPDAIERPGGMDRDTDMDGTPDHLDADDDGDGIPTIDERPGGMDRDTDMDGAPDHLDADDDGDGIPTIDERPDGMDRDTDMDGAPDHHDPDDDGDGVPTIDERPAGADIDTDMDGIPDHLDPEDGANAELGALAGGAGCSASGSPDVPLGWMAAWLILVLALRRRSVSIGVVAALTVAAAPAEADTPRLTLDQYTPAPTVAEGFAVARPDAYGHGRWALQLQLSYANDPLVFERMQGEPDTELDHAVVSDQLVAHLGGAIGLADDFVVFARLPVHLVLAGDAPDGIHSGTYGTTLGDFVLGGRYVLPSPDGADFAIQLAGTAPLARATDDGASYAGDSGFTLLPALLGAVDLGGARVALELGARVRDGDRVANLDVGSELTYGLGVGVPFADGAAEARVELFGATGLSDFGAREGSPLEVLGGVAARPHASSGFVGGIALGTGLTRGYGAPDARVVLTAGYVEPAPQPAIEEPPAPPPRDSDGDGLVDDVDACPTDPEDPDGFEDEDGCPDADNDGDGLLDADDQCPMDAEDADGFEDENGCPDPDNDGDGVLDVDDRCPAEPEDLDNVADQDGCPEEDADEDTVLDPDDRCPTTAGAPNRRNADCNGCPERACITATGMIQILERVEFETNSAEIRSQSEAVLRDVLSILETSPQIVRVRIEGHTDDRGDDAYNLELSQRRGESVMRWLVEHGLSAGRLEAQGFGETRPLRPGRSTRARQANRRVEFHIVPQESAPQK